MPNRSHSIEYKLTHNTAMSKLSNILYAEELQRRLVASGSPIIVTSTYPGAIYTFGDRLPAAARILLAPVLKGCFKSPAVGAETQVFAAASPEIKAEPDKYRGQYVVSAGPAGKFNLKTGKGTEQARNMELAADLWKTTEDFLGRIGIHTSGPEKIVAPSSGA